MFEVKFFFSLLKHLLLFILERLFVNLLTFS